MLKSGVLSKKLTNFTVEYLQNREYSEQEIFWINFTNNGELKTLW